MADGIPEYHELKVRIEAVAGHPYRVRAEAADGSTAAGTFSLPFDETKLENFVLKVGSPRRATRAFGGAEMAAAQEFGSELFESVFSGGVRDVYRSARERAWADDKGLRLTMYLSDAPDLQHVPWEFLYEPPMFLAHSVETPVVRSLDLELQRRPKKVELPLRILGVDSRPQGAVPLDADAERHNLEEALAGLQERGLVELVWLERATLRELQRTLDRPDDFHVIHYIGHGAYNESSGNGTLLLEHQDGTLHQVTGTDLGSVLFDERSLRLAVLNACEGARASHRDPFSGVASSLVACGIPAVVGMQFEITDEAAVTFAEQFYTSLADSYPVDASLAQARRAIWAERHNTEFGTPVLFLRAADARLFDVRPSQPGLPAIERPAAKPKPKPKPEPEAEPKPKPEASAKPAPPPPSEQPEQWQVEEVENTRSVRALALRLSHETHFFRIESTFFKGKVILDGKTIGTRQRDAWDGVFEFRLTDGPDQHEGALTIKAGKASLNATLQLHVGGRLLYEDAPLWGGLTMW